MIIYSQKGFWENGEFVVMILRAGGYKKQIKNS